MNLHGIVVGAIATVNPLVAASVRISTGPSAPSPGGVRTPTFATPGAFTATVADGIMTVTAQSAGTIQVGQTIVGADVAPGTEIADLGTGTGGLGTYVLDRPSTVTDPVAMTAAYLLQAQIQPVTWRDVQQMDGLNLQGTRIKAYLFGKVDGLVRTTNKGGDLLTVASGPYAGTYLVAQIAEQWSDWVCAFLTLQNGS